MPKIPDWVLIVVLMLLIIADMGFQWWVITRISKPKDPDDKKKEAS